MHFQFSKMWLAMVNWLGSILLYNDAWPLTLQKLANLGYKTLPHLPYSLHFSPTDYHFFNYLEKILSQKKMQKMYSDFLVPKHLEFSSKGTNNLVTRWQEDVQDFYFDWFKYCLNALIQELNLILKMDLVFWTT